MQATVNIRDCHYTECPMGLLVLHHESVIPSETPIQVW